MQSQKWVQKILLVEDNLPTRRLMLKYFEKAKNNKHLNCVVFEASNGKEAVAIIRKEQPDLILSDINMPEVNGYQLLNYFRKKYAKDNPYCFFCFVSASKEEKQTAFKHGANGFVTKDEINYFAFTLQLKTWLRLVFLERTLEIKREIAIF